MSIRQPSGEIVIDLDGPQGNAFVLLGYAQKYAKQIGLDWDKINAEMTASGYVNLVRTFDKYFGEVITLETTREFA
jgi:hypothetical protein